MIEETTIHPDDWRSIQHLLPGSEPQVACTAPRGRMIAVADTRLDGNELAYLTRCVHSNWISSAGPFVGEFEQAFAGAMGCRHGVACSSGTAALHLALAALGIGPGDEVVIPAFTMIATANAVRYAGAEPVLVDSEPHTWNLDVSQLESRLTPQTRAIVVVHTYGHPAEMGAILALARGRGLAVIEDAAEAHGATYRDQPVGCLGDVACFSFYANKIITTGEGGMVTSNNANLAARVRRLRDHAFSNERHFWHKYQGFNYRMTNLQAAVGLAQTERLGELVGQRRANAHRYRIKLAGVLGITLPVELSHVRNVFWMFGLLIDDRFGCSRDVLRNRLAERGIETRTFFIPVHLQPIYFDRFRRQRFPVAEDLCRRGLYLPSGPGLTVSDIDYIIESVRAAAVQQRAA
jgi:perosamine synthetase